MKFFYDKNYYKNVYNKWTLKKAIITLLLVSFLISGILGLIMAFLIDYKISISWYQDFLWIHVEFGIAMATIALFHTLWHIKYYLSYLPKKK